MRFPAVRNEPGRVTLGSTYLLSCCQQVLLAPAPFAKALARRQGPPWAQRARRGTGLAAGSAGGGTGVATQGKVQGS